MRFFYQENKTIYGSIKEATPTPNFQSANWRKSSIRRKTGKRKGKLQGNLVNDLTVITRKTDEMSQ